LIQEADRLVIQRNINIGNVKLNGTVIGNGNGKSQCDQATLRIVRSRAARHEGKGAKLIVQFELDIARCIDDILLNLGTSRIQVDAINRVGQSSLANRGRHGKGIARGDQTGLHDHVHAIGRVFAQDRHGLLLIGRRWTGQVLARGLESLTIGTGIALASRHHGKLDRLHFHTLRTQGNGRLSQGAIIGQSIGRRALDFHTNGRWWLWV
jgi:hypothetical protein